MFMNVFISVTFADRFHANWHLFIFKSAAMPCVTHQTGVIWIPVLFRTYIGSGSKMWRISDWICHFSQSDKKSKLGVNMWQTNCKNTTEFIFAQCVHCLVNIFRKHIWREKGFGFCVFFSTLLQHLIPAAFILFMPRMNTNELSHNKRAQKRMRRIFLYWK